MNDVMLTFNGRSYKLACAEGEVDRLLALARHVKARLETLLATHGQVGDERLLLMLVIELTDQLWDAEAARDAAVQRAEAAERTLAQRPEPRASRKSASAPGTG